MEAWIISALSVVTLGLCTVVWWILQRYIDSDQKWKNETDLRMIRHAKSIEQLKGSLELLEAHVKQMLRDSSDRQQAKFVFIQDDLKTLSKRIDHLHQNTATNEDLGKIIVLERKVEAIFDVIKKANNKKS